MPTKIFTTLGGKCPFGMGCDIDTQPCRNCKHFYRAGTGMFFWCNHHVPEKTDSVLKSDKSVPKARKSVPKASKDAPKRKKRGRPAKKAILRPINAKKEKNG